MEPVIKVRYKESVLILAFLAFHSAFGAFPKCDKTPKETHVEKMEGSNGFAVAIVGSPLKYRPNQVYTISLKNTDDVEEIKKFQSFIMVAEPTFEIPADREVSLGSFQLIPGDAMVKFSHRCSNAVEATSSISKEHVSVYWKAPPPNTGCIDFKAMVEERKDVWYSDDNLLTYTLCEDDSPMAEPPEVQPCCACNEAKYELIFEGVWSRHTHPKDFPPNEWRTEFSPIIGASHSVNYSLWEISRLASPSLQLLGEIGITSKLEKDMKRYSPHIRSVIKAHGLEQRSNLIGQTFAVFRVDPIHHLISFVSKMVPSPDWIVGLSKENICLANCSWVANRVIDLYPWDIGTQSGLRYDSPNMPTRPRSPIQRITSSNPNNPESPFYDRTFAPIKPVARIHLIRQREYTKDCPAGMRRPRPQTNINPNTWKPGITNTNQGSGNSFSGYDPISNYGNTGYNTNYQDNSQYGGDQYGAPAHNYITPRYDNFGGGNSYVYGGKGNDPSLDSDSYGNDDSQQGNYNINNDNSLDNSNVFETNTNSYGNSNYDPYGSGNSYSYGSNTYDNTNSGYGTSQSYGQDNSNPNSWDGNNMDLDNSPLDDPCAVTQFGPWDECSASCGTASRNRRREYIDPFGASKHNCMVKLLEKEPCYGLKECEKVSYDNTDDSFTPFSINDQASSGSQYTWQGSGLQSDGLVAKPVSYTYTGGNSPPFDSYTDQDLDPFNNRDDDSNNVYGVSYTYGGSTDNPTYAKLNQPQQQGTSFRNCDVTNWGSWSDCNTKCGSGIKTRTRRYKEPENSTGCSQELDDDEDCWATSPTCTKLVDDTRFTKWNVQTPDNWQMSNNNHLKQNSNQKLGRGRNKFQVSRNPGFRSYGNAGDCDLAEWSDWSPCSKKCGKGMKRRTRLFKVPFVPDRNCDVRLIDRISCQGQDPSCSTMNNDYGTSSFYDGGNNDDNNYSYDLGDDSALDDGTYRGQLLVKPLNLMKKTQYYQPMNVKRVDCTENPDPGPCNGHFSRWYFDQITQTCKIFSYRGCQGNSNNFPTEQRCKDACDSYVTATVYRRDSTQLNYNGRSQQLKSLSSVKVQDDDDHFNIAADSPQDETHTKVDCIVSAWTEWSPCSTSCGPGWVTRQREVLVGAKNSGKPCPKKLTKKRRCNDGVCPKTNYWYRGSWRHMVSNNDIRPD